MSVTGRPDADAVKQGLADLAKGKTTISIQTLLERRPLRPRGQLHAKSFTSTTAMPVPEPGRSFS